MDSAVARPLAELAVELVTLREERDELSAKLKAVEETMDGLKIPILAQMQETGIQSIKANGRTVYLERKLWAGREDGVTKEVVCDALSEAGLGEYVEETYNANSLSAWLRGQPEDPATGMPSIPPELVGKLKASETFEVRVRKS